MTAAQGPKRFEAHTKEEHGHHHGDGFGDEMPFYLPPKQRQRWGEEQHPVHNNWQDIFYDLFFVALAYNLGNLLREDPTWQGLLYFCACFLPAIVLWHSKLYWDSRYINQGDLVHVFAEVATHVALASTVQHVRPVAILSDVKHNVDMFTFSLSILVGNTIYLIRLLEVVFCVKVVNTKGLYEEAYHASKRDLISLLLPSFFYLASAIYSGMEYFGYDATLYNSKGDDLYQNDNHGHRDLAETPSSFYESGSWSGSDVAAWLCLSGSIGSLFIVLFIFGCWSDYAKRSGLDLKTLTIPMNIDYSIHRYGEWTMLLLGESVLSLLIVDLSEGGTYYQTFFCGVLSVILLEYLHFRSQPHNPDEHALRKTAMSALLFTNLMYVYSIALVVLGTCYKMFLFEFVYESKGERRFLSPIVQRLLAGGESAALRFETDDRQQRIAHFFSASLALVFFCLDGMSLAHKGISANVDRCQCDKTQKVRNTVILLVIFRVALIVFFATLSQYCTDPAILAALGFGGIVVQLAIRVLGAFLFPADEEEQEDRALDRVANYLNARINH